MLEPTCAVSLSVFNREHMTFALNMSAFLLDGRADLANALRSVSIDVNKVVRINFIPVLTKQDLLYVQEKFEWVRAAEQMHGLTLQIT